jgi:hypothetical protein
MPLFNLDHPRQPLVMGPPIGLASLRAEHKFRAPAGLLPS